MEARTAPLLHLRLMFLLLHFLAESHGGDDPLQPGSISHMASAPRCKSSMRAPPRSATFGAHAGVRGGSGVCVHTAGMCARGTHARPKMSNICAGFPCKVRSERRERMGRGQSPVPFMRKRVTQIRSPWRRASVHQAAHLDPLMYWMLDECGLNAGDPVHWDPLDDFEVWDGGPMIPSPGWQCLLRLSSHCSVV